MNVPRTFRSPRAAEPSLSLSRARAAGRAPVLPLSLTRAAAPAASARGGFALQEGFNASYAYTGNEFAVKVLEDAALEQWCARYGLAYDPAVALADTAPGEPRAAGGR